MNFIARKWVYATFASMHLFYRWIHLQIDSNVSSWGIQEFEKLHLRRAENFCLLDWLLFFIFWQMCKFFAYIWHQHFSWYPSLAPLSLWAISVMDFLKMALVASVALDQDSGPFLSSLASITMRTIYVRSLTPWNYFIMQNLIYWNAQHNFQSTSYSLSCL